MAASTGADATVRDERQSALVRHAPTIGFVAANLLAPIVLFLLMCAWNGIHPLGPVSFLTEDLKYQYVDFFVWFRKIIVEGGTFAYSAGQGLGVSSWAQLAYYLSSPFNFLVVLFDAGHICEAIEVIVVAKLCVMQVAWAYYLRKRFELDYKWAFLLALCVTWASWTIFNLRNPLWLDMLYLLPFVMWGCWALVRKGRWLMLTLATAATIITCWYMGYMAIIFCILFVLFEAWVAHTDDKSLDWRYFLKRALQFAACMFGVIGLAAWTFVPTILSTAGQGTDFATWEPGFHLDVYSIVAGFFTGAIRLDINPQLACGTIALLLCLAYLFDGRVTKRERFAYLIVLFFLLASCYLNVLEWFWCGMRTPHGFYCRYAIFAAVFVVWGAAREARLIVSEGLRPLPLGISAGVIAVCIGLVWLQGCFEFTLNAILCVVVLLLVGGLLVGHFVAVKRDLGTLARVTFVLLFLVSGAELLRCSHLCARQLYPDPGYTQEQYDLYTQNARDQLDVLQQMDPGVWRMEKTYTRAGLAALNESASLGYLGVSEYSSVYNRTAVDFLCLLGYSNAHEFSARYASPIPSSDAMLGVRYAFSEEPEPLLQEVSEVPKTVWNDAHAYRNPWALGLGYGVSDAVLGSLPNSDNPFEVQNAYASALLGEDIKVFEPLEGVTETKGDETMAWEANVPEGRQAYYYVQGYNVWVTLNEQPELFECNRFAHAIRELGVGSGTQRLTARPDIAGMWEFPQTNVLFYTINQDALDRLSAALGAHPFEISSFTDGAISGTYQADSDGIMLLSVPWDGGWKLTVNGSEVQPQKAFDGAQMAIPVSAGANQIQLRYETKAQFPSIALTIVSCLVVAGLYALPRVRNRRKDN